MILSVVQQGLSFSIRLGWIMDESSSGGAEQQVLTISAAEGIHHPSQGWSKPDIQVDAMERARSKGEILSLFLPNQAKGVGECLIESDVICRRLMENDPLDVVRYLSGAIMVDHARLLEGLGTTFPSWAAKPKHPVFQSDDPVPIPRRLLHALTEHAHAYLDYLSVNAPRSLLATKQREIDAAILESAWLLNPQKLKTGVNR